MRRHGEPAAAVSRVPGRTSSDPVSLLGVVVLVVALALSGCTVLGGPRSADAVGSARAHDGPPPRSWAPRPVHRHGLRLLAQSDAHGLRLHTASGDKTFLPGVNLGSTTPLHQPGEVGGIPASTYRRWFQQMGDLGIRVLRVYTLHPPAFYDELARYDRDHPRAPLYLVQGVYLPDESYVEEGHTLEDPSVDRGFSRELRDVSAAVHGDLTRPVTPGRASGTWHTDVSRWVASWIVGVEWDPAGVQRTDALDVDHRARRGRYFSATTEATTTEVWLARHLDLLAGLEHDRGVSVPISFANWPTADPIHHPREPDPDEDLVGVDANHVLPTRAWPGGTFASFHAYPYYPDFQRYQPGLRHARWRGRADPYLGYLEQLRDHFAGRMPLVVAEFGVPGSLGSAHRGPLGRDQGGHTEAQAMATDADLLQLMAAHGLAGGFVFAWSDEWFKRTWNTERHQQPDRRQLWHDPLTNEQWFGLLAADSRPVPDAAAEATPPTGRFRYVYVHADASWVYVELTLRGALPHQLTVASDTVALPVGDDYRVTADLDAASAQAWVRAPLDPIRLDSAQRPSQPDMGRPWHRFRLLTNRSYRVAGRVHPAEFDDVGRLREGSWDPRKPAYDSRATWQVDATHDTVRFRLPWAMLGLADPSSRTALGTGPRPRMVPVDGLHLSFDADGADSTLDFTWPTWNFVLHHERLKDGVGVLARAFRSLAP